MRSNRKYKLDDFQWIDFFPAAEPVFETIIPKEIKQRKPKKPLAEVNKNGKIISKYSTHVGTKIKDSQIGRFPSDRCRNDPNYPIGSYDGLLER